MVVVEVLVVSVVVVVVAVNLYPPRNYGMKSGKKKFLPQIVTSELSLDKAAFIFLCDAYEKLNENTDREMLRFSKAIAPYKVSFAGNWITSDNVQNLKELTLLLAKKIKQLGIPVLLLPDIGQITIEKHLIRNDALGIPYTIILNNSTLKDGIITLRSRDTTLEVSHYPIISKFQKLLLLF